MQPRRRLPSTTYSRKSKTPTTERDHPYKRHWTTPPSPPCPTSLGLRPSSLEPYPTPTPPLPPPRQVFSIFRAKTPTTKHASATRTRQPQLTQLTLDLGQAQRTTCPGCGMSYHISDPSDTTIHRRFHTKASGGVEVPAASPGLRRLWEEGGNEVLRALASERRKVREVLEVVDCDLGAAPVPDSVLWSDRFRVYLYSVPVGRARRRMVGLLLAERIEEAFVAVGEAGNVKLGERKRAVMGVCRVWTAGVWRRRGVARRLLEIARENFVYGLKLEKGEVAFSQPTESGGRLAMGWIGGGPKKDEGVEEVDGNAGDGNAGDGNTTTTDTNTTDTNTTDTMKKKGGGEEWLVYVERD